jgi:hypothetical protein
VISIPAAATELPRPSAIAGSNGAITRASAETMKTAACSTSSSCG